MTRRPRSRAAKAKATKSARARRGAPRRQAKAARRGKPDPLDAFVATAARSLDLPCPKAWRSGIKANVRVTLQLAALVTAFPLPDEAEPAPVFKA